MSQVYLTFNRKPMGCLCLVGVCRQFGSLIEVCGVRGPCPGWQIPRCRLNCVLLSWAVHVCRSQRETHNDIFSTWITTRPLSLMKEFRWECVPPTAILGDLGGGPTPFQTPPQHSAPVLGRCETYVTIYDPSSQSMIGAFHATYWPYMIFGGVP